MSVSEIGGTATVPVSLGRASSDDVSIAYRSKAVTTLAGSDYVEAIGTLTISPGSTRGDTSVGLITEAADENPETLVLRLSDPTNAVLGRFISTCQW